MSYMFCDSKKEAETLYENAVNRVPEILKEFSLYFPNNGKVGIEVEKKLDVYFWSVTANLTYDGEIIRRYESFDLLELDLLNMELGIMRR